MLRIFIFLFCMILWHRVNGLNSGITRGLNQRKDCDMNFTLEASLRVFMRTPLVTYLLTHHPAPAPPMCLAVIVKKSKLGLISDHENTAEKILSKSLAGFWWGVLGKLYHWRLPQVHVTPDKLHKTTYCISCDVRNKRNFDSWMSRLATRFPKAHEENTPKVFIDTEEPIFPTEGIYSSGDYKTLMNLV